MMIGRPFSMRKASTSEIGYYDRTFGPSPPAYQLRTCAAFIAGRAFGDGERKVRARCAVLRPPRRNSCGAEGDGVALHTPDHLDLRQRLKCKSCRWKDRADVSIEWVG
jgi:hypothetical protein